MKTIKLILTVLFGLFMIFGGVNHFLTPDLYLPFIPDALPKLAIIYASGVVEIALGLAAFFPRTRGIATLGIFLLMIAFLPLHVIDVFKEHPAVGSHQIALIRLPLQFVLIAWAWFIHKK
jgi:uncharacterized membrane protein